MQHPSCRRVHRGSYLRSVKAPRSDATRTALEEYALKYSLQDISSSPPDLSEVARLRAYISEGRGHFSTPSQPGFPDEGMPLPFVFSIRFPGNFVQPREAKTNMLAILADRNTNGCLSAQVVFLIDLLVYSTGKRESCHRMNTEPLPVTP